MLLAPLDTSTLLSWPVALTLSLSGPLHLVVAHERPMCDPPPGTGPRLAGPSGWALIWERQRLFLLGTEPCPQAPVPP